MSISRWPWAILLVVLSTACAAEKAGVTTSPAANQSAQDQAQPQPTTNWPATLPADGIQPWETTDSAGHVVPPARLTSAVNAQSIAVAGAETFSTGGAVSTFGEASHLPSGVFGSGLLAYAAYRLTLGGVQPGVVSVDANVANGDSSYYVGLSDYAAGHWQWRGPFKDNHVRLVKVPGQLDSANYLSGSGNLFVAVAVYDGSSADVIDVGTNPVTDGDAALPPAPAAFSATPVTGGFLLEWTPSAAGDLAGYRVLWDNQGFTGPESSSVLNVLYAEGSGRYFLPRQPQRYTFMALQAIDIAGNAGPLTNVVDAVPLRGTPPRLAVASSLPSGEHDTPITLTATGAISYDFDLDGDGVYDVTGDTTGIAQVDTSKTGVIRPGVRGHSADGLAVALGGVSLIITGNTRPAVSAVALPQAGPAPLLVNFSATAQDSEDPQAALTYDWDFDGDGIYEAGTNQPSLQHTYSTVGTFNAKVRVTDSEGAWSVDTVSIDATGNTAPTVTAQASPQTGNFPLLVTFTATAQDKEDAPGALTYAWDFDGDGVYENGTNQLSLQHSYPAAGVFNASVRVTDTKGAQATYPVTIVVTTANLSPVASVSFASAQELTPLALRFDFDGGASLDPDGGPLRFDWDFDGDGNYDLLQTAAQVSHHFGAMGLYQSTLRVTDSQGATDSIVAPVHVPSAWNSYHGDPSTNTRQSSVLAAQTNHRKWTFTAPNTVLSSPAVEADGTIVFGCTDNVVYGLHDNGTAVPTIKWSFPTSGQVLSSPAVGPDGTIYIGSSDNWLYALIDKGTPTPTLRWKVQMTAAVASSPTVGGDGTVYVGVNAPDSSVYALVDNGTTTPTIKWFYPTSGGIAGSPAVGSDNTVYVSSDDGLVYALVDTGALVASVKWSFNAGSAAGSASPTLGPDGTVFVGNLAGTLFALKDNGTATPSLRWSFVTGGSITGAPAVGTDGTVYVGSSDNVMYALLDSGGPVPTLKWSYATLNKIQTSAAIGADGLVYIGSRDNTFYAFQYDGTTLPVLKWNYNTGTQVRTSPAIDGAGTVYVASGSVVYAFGP